MNTTYLRSIALKWYFFTLSSLAVFGEFFHLFMKQLGFNPKQIGITTLFGVPNLLVPLFNLVGDKFRARRDVLWIMSGCAIIDCILPLLPLLVSLPTCFGTLQSIDSTEILVKAQSVYKNGSVHLPNVTMKTVTNYQPVPWMSKLFFVMLLSRSLITPLEAVMQSSSNVATMTYLGEERAKFGLYWMWNQVGAGVSIVITATLARFLRTNVCGKEDYGYFVAFIVAGVLIVSSLLSIPWFEFKYEDNRTINWNDVKGVLKRHYIFIFALVYYLGVCTSFQLFWGILVFRWTARQSTGDGWGSCGSKTIAGCFDIYIYSSDKKDWRRYTYHMPCASNVLPFIFGSFVHSSVLVCSRYRCISSGRLWIGLQCIRCAFVKNWK